MLREKEFKTSGSVTAGAPVVLNKDGTISAVDIEGKHVEGGFEWVSTLPNDIRVTSLDYDPVNNHLWVLYVNSSNSSSRDLVAFTIQGRKLIQVTPPYTNALHNSPERKGIGFDRVNNILLGGYRDQGGSYTTTIVGFRVENGKIVRKFNLRDQISSSKYTGGGEEFEWCELRQCLLFFRQQGNKPFSVHSLNASETGYTVHGQATLSIYGTSGVNWQIDQKTGVGICSYRQFRMNLSTPNRATIRAFKINDDRTITMGAIRDVYNQPGSSNIHAVLPTILLHRETSKWLIGYNYGGVPSRFYTVDDSLNLISGAELVPDPGRFPTEIEYDEATKVYFMKGNGAYFHYHFDANGNLQGRTKYPGVVNNSFVSRVTVDNKTMYVSMNYNKGGLFDVSGKTTNLAEKNLIGFCAESASDDQDTNVQLIFGNAQKVTVNQSDLVVGKRYYLGFDGSLLNEDRGYGYAGVAIANNAILTQG